MYNEIVGRTVPHLPIHIAFSRVPGLRGSVSGLHYHDEIELLKVNQGRMGCVAAGEKFEISPGETLFINSRVPHETACLTDGTCSVLVQFNADTFFGETAPAVHYLSRLLDTGSARAKLLCADSDLSCCVDNAVREYAQKKDAYEMYIRSYICQILGFLYREGLLMDSEQFFDSKTIGRVLPALHYIESNYAEALTLEQLSKQVNLNPCYFCRLFKRATNRTPTEYLNFVRICKSEALLSDVSNSIMDISLAVGFSSVSYFNRSFRRYKGCTPSAYRKIKYE